MVYFKTLEILGLKNIWEEVDMRQLKYLLGSQLHYTICN